MSVPKPRILFVAPILPARSGNGLAMRIGLFLEALSGWTDVDLLVVPVAGGTVEPTPFLLSLGAGIKLLSVQPEFGTHFTMLSRIIDLVERVEAFKAYGKPSLASGLSQPVLRRVDELTRTSSYNLIHVCRSYMIPVIEMLGRTKTPITIDLDEDDRASFASRASLAREKGDTALANWLEQEGVACDHLVSANLHRIAHAFSASGNDCRTIAQRHLELLIEPVPNAVEIPRHSKSVDDGRTLVFVGSFGYQPNIDGLLWFATSVFPALKARIGPVRLLIAGANPPKAVCGLQRSGSIHVLGWLEDLSKLYRSASLAIAPTMDGGGTRIKVLEAASFGVPSVVTTAVAAPLFGRVHPWGWICSNRASFLAGCAEAITNPKERARRGQYGQAAIRKLYSRAVVVSRVRQIFKNCLT